MFQNTPISHMDHPKLLEALRQMSFLASMMNESKRRKELGQLIIYQSPYYFCISNIQKLVNNLTTNYQSVAIVLPYN